MRVSAKGRENTPAFLSCVLEEGNPAGLSSCSGGLRPLVELCVEPAGLCGRCTGQLQTLEQEAGRSLKKDERIMSYL